MPRKKTYEYTQEEAEYFIKYLGCHKYANPTDAIKRRDPHKYRQDLIKLIVINRTSRINGDGKMDETAQWENYAALEALKRLSQ